MGKNQSLSKKSFGTGMVNEYSTLHGQYTGYHSAKIERSKPRSYGQHRKTQFLTHFATTLKTWHATLKDGSEIEIQIAEVRSESGKEVYFIGTNKNSTAERLHKELVEHAANEFDKTAPTMHDTLVGMSQTAVTAAQGSKGTDAFRKERHAKKFQRALQGSRKKVPLPELKSAARDLCISINASEDVAQSVLTFIEDPTSTPTVAFVTSDDDMHAEQKILLALCKAYAPAANGKPRMSATFAGTFRPCRGCYESLRMVQRYLFENLSFGSREGHYWHTTDKAHVMLRKILIDAGRIGPAELQNDFDNDGLMKGFNNVSHRPSLRLKKDFLDDLDEDALHYASDSDSEAD